MDEQTAGGHAGRPGVARRRFLGGAAVTAAGAGAAWLGLRGVPGAGRSAAEIEPRPAAWRLSSRGAARDIEGYPDRASVRPGEAFDLQVSTTADGFRVSAFRVGWYDGEEAGLVWRSERCAGRRQPGPAFDAATRTVSADWPAALTVPTDGWPPGAYLLRLEGDHGHQRYVPLVVRSATGAGRTVLVHAVATWQAYNRWGGYNLYEGEDGDFGSRSLKVSFDRPYDGSGAETFLVYERAAVVLAERLGIPLAYTTGPDVDLDPAVLEGAASVLLLGHDEYWTPERRRQVTRARDAGSNVAVLGANTCYRRIRLEDGRAGPARTVVCYKSDHRDDPYAAGYPSLVTTDFRSEPGADPESALTGVLYEGYPTDAPFVVHRPDHWLFEGTGVSRAESFPHLVGAEYDRVTPGQPTPRPLEVLAHSPLTCRGRPSHADAAYYTAASGAGVFASGTMRWVEGLMAGTDENGENHGMDARTGAFVTRVTENLLRAFAEGPAGEHRPAPRDNVDAYH